MSADRYRLEAWTLLSWIASRHPGITVGTSVLVDAFRSPPLLAKMVASLMALTGCRMIVGYGAGWDEPEFRAFGYPFGTPRERLDRMDESLEVMRRLWEGGFMDHAGPSHRLEGAIVEPTPPTRPLLMVGGESTRSIEIAVRRADWWNIVHVPDDLARRAAQVDEACARAGRDPASLRRSVYLNVFLAELGGGCSAAQRVLGSTRRQRHSPARPRASSDHLAGLVELGFDAFQLVFADFPATTDIESFLERTLPAFRTAA